jgi:hypothetical protein
VDLARRQQVVSSLQFVNDATRYLDMFKLVHKAARYFSAMLAPDSPQLLLTDRHEGNLCQSLLTVKMVKVSPSPRGFHNK